MSGRVYDRIYWCAPDAHIPRTFTGLAHVCPSAVVIAQTTREQLDPMALGTCRYCGERLPMSPDKETDPSSDIS